MGNPNPNQTGLVKRKWNHTPTVAVRIPEQFSDQIIDIARQLDVGENIAVQRNTDDIKKAIRILSEAQNLKPNAGGAIKKEIRKALQILKNNVVQ